MPPLKGSRDPRERLTKHPPPPPSSCPLPPSAESSSPVSFPVEVFFPVAQHTPDRLFFFDFTRVPLTQAFVSDLKVAVTGCVMGEQGFTALLGTKNKVKSKPNQTVFSQSCFCPWGVSPFLLYKPRPPFIHQAFPPTPTPGGLRDLSSPTRDRTHAPCSGSAEP